MNPTRSKRLVWLATTLVAGVFGVWCGTQWAPSNEDRGARASAAIETRDAVVSALGGGGQREQSTFEGQLAWAREVAELSVEDYPAILESLGRDSGGSGRFYKLFRTWCKTDPEGCYEWLKVQPAEFRLDTPGNTHIDLQKPLLDALALHDPSLAWEAAVSLPGGSRTYRCYGVIRDLVRAGEHDVALELVRKGRFELSRDFNGSGAWARVDPIEIVPLIAELPPSRARIYWLTDSANYFGHGELDLVKAGSWYEALPSDLKKVVSTRAVDWRQITLTDELRTIWEVEGERQPLESNVIGEDWIKLR